MKDQIVRKLIPCLFTLFCVLFLNDSAKANVGGYCQLGAGNWDRSYVLTGIGADDVVAVAEKQLGKGTSTLGYTGDWCAAFINDVFKLANQADAAPFVSGQTHAVVGLRSKVLSQGGVSVSSSEKKKGDLIFYWCTKCGSYVHVGICYDNGKKRVEGNVGSQVKIYDTSYNHYWENKQEGTSGTHFEYNGEITLSYVRPNYVKDTTKPIINSARITGITKNGYNVAFTASDNQSIRSIQFGTWNTTDGINQAKWTEIPGATSGSAYIDVTGFNTNTNTTFYTNVYAFDNTGNVSEACMTEAVYIEAVPPTVTSAKIQNVTSTGYDIVCEGSDNIGVWKFQIGTWHDNMSSSDAKWQETVATNGKATFHVTIADFGNTVNTTYHTNVYAFDLCQNVSASVRAGNPYITNNPYPVTGVSLDYSEARLDLGSKQTIQLHATVSPSNATIKTVTWTSSNTAVATVSNTGLVTPVGAGSANITVKTTDQNKTATCAITVKQSLNLGTGFVAHILHTNSGRAVSYDTAQENRAVLYTKNAGDDKQYWTFTRNSDGSYTIKSGSHILTAMGDGNHAKVSAPTSDAGVSSRWFLYTNGSGVHLHPASSYLCNMDLADNISADGKGLMLYQEFMNDAQRYTIQKVTRVQSLTFSGAPLDKSNNRRADLNLGTRQTIALNPTITPAEATYKDITFTSSNPAVATVSAAGVVTPVAVGSAVITGTTKDGAKTASFTAYVRQCADLGTGFWAEISAADGRLLTKDAAGFSMREKNYGENQFWYFTKNNDGSYCLASEGLMLTMDQDKYGSSTQGNTNLSAKAQNGSDGQKWFLYPRGDAYWLHSAMSYLQCVDIADGSTVDGAVVRSWESNNGVAEQFFITKVNRVSGIVSDWEVKTLNIRDSVQKEIPISVEPADVTYPDLIWTNSDESVALIENGKIIPKSEGKTTITATTRDGGYSVSAVILVADGELDNTGMTLPKDLQTIGKDAFAGLPVTAVHCPEGLDTISEDAFRSCKNLRQIEIPGSKTEILEKAFRDCGTVTIFGKEGSKAQQFAKEHEMPFFPLPD